MPQAKRPRKICNSCHTRLAAINYTKNGVTYYREQCYICSKKKSPAITAWAKIGYKKKLKCEKCGFKAKVTEQLGVTYVDGNENNITFPNLKTICLNCQAEIIKKRLKWSSGDLIPDF